MIEIFRAGGQLIKVRAIMWLAAGCAAAALYYGWVLFQSYGLRPADGGALAPIGQRLGWLLGLGGMGLAFLAGMWAYGRCYVARIGYDQAGQRLHFRTLSFVGSHEHVHHVSDVRASTFQSGRFINPDGVSVNAPWYNVYLKGRRLPLVLDVQGDFREPELTARLLKAQR